MTLTLNGLSWLGATMTALAVGSGTWLILDRLYALYHHWWAMRTGRWQSTLARWQDYEDTETILSEESLYGIDPDFIQRFRLTSISIGMVLGAWSFASGAQGPGIIIATLGIVIPRWWLKIRRERRMWDILRQVRDFTITLNLAVSLSGSLVWALRDISKQDDLQLNQRLQHHLERHNDPLIVLKRLAADLRSPHLKELTQRLQAVEHGAGGQQDAVLVAVDAISVDLQETAAEAIEGTPLRLMLPMLITLLPPILIILMIPMVGRVLAIISGKAF